MPRLVHRLPAYRLHKPSGKAVVTLSGRQFYLGNFNSPESKREYDRLVGEWKAGRRIGAPAVRVDLSVNEVVARFMAYAKEHYRKATGNLLPDGSPEYVPTSTIQGFIEVLRIVARAYGHTQASIFGPLALRACRDEMIRIGWSRKYVNKQVSSIRTVFRWAESHELVPGGMTHALETVKGLQAGRTTAHETEPVLPVDEHHARSVKPYVSDEVAAMIELQLLTGMRPGEVTSIRGCDLDTSGEVWIYEPEHHKTKHAGKRRMIMFGPRCRAIIEPFLKPDMKAFLFSPAEAERRRLEAKSAARVTPLNAGNVPGRNKRRRPRKTPGPRYTTNSYAKAIKYGCRVAFPAPARAEIESLVSELAATERIQKSTARERILAQRKDLVEAMRAHDAQHSFHPHQLRHSHATKIRKKHGIEGAQVMLGHSSLKVTEIYAERDIDSARRIAAAEC